jgi:hypothetical protein
MGNESYETVIKDVGPAVDVLLHAIDQDTFVNNGDCKLSMTDLTATEEVKKLHKSYPGSFKRIVALTVELIGSEFNRNRLREALIPGSIRASDWKE